MAHYAFLDEHNVVTDVITGREENEVIEGVSDWEEWYGNLRNQVCKRTSYNTFADAHRNGGIPFRKNYAGVGYTFDGVGFAAPQPYASWTLNADTYIWEAPTPYPTDDKRYTWNEDTLTWVEIA